MPPLRVVRVVRVSRDMSATPVHPYRRVIALPSVAAPNAARFVAGAAEVRGVVIVPGRLVNVVTGGA